MDKYGMDSLIHVQILTSIDVRARISRNFLLVYVDMTIYPCLHLHGGLDNLF